MLTNQHVMVGMLRQAAGRARRALELAQTAMPDEPEFTKAIAELDEALRETKGPSVDDEERVVP
jgi:hypothetical protein